MGVETIDNIQTIIELIPAIFSYFVPGAIFIYIYLIFLNEHFTDKHIAPSVIISYCICTICNLIFNGWTAYYHWNYVLYFIFGVGFGVLYCLIINSKYYKDIITKIHVSPPTNIYLETIGLDNQTNLIVYTSDGKMYLGHPVYWDGEWLALSSYHMISKDGECDDWFKDVNKTLNIPVNNIIRFEALYTNNSSVAKSFFK